MPTYFVYNKTTGKISYKIETTKDVRGFLSVDEDVVETTRKEKTSNKVVDVKTGEVKRVFTKLARRASLGEVIPKRDRPRPGVKPK